MNINFCNHARVPSMHLNAIKITKTFAINIIINNMIKQSYYIEK